MEALFLYIGKLILCSGVMFLYYKLSLKNKTFHHYNRFYLLGSVVISIFLPLLKVEYFTIEVNENWYLLLNKFQSINPDKNINHGFSYYSLLLTALGLVAIFFVAKILFGIFKIVQLKKQFPQQEFEGIHFYETNLQEAPFSFFRNLFWKNSIEVQSQVGKQILKHEMVHIEQKHSLDKLFVELSTAVFWFNPFFYFIKKELYLIHEYLADNKAVKHHDTQTFAQMLLASHFSGTSLPATSPFLSSNLKKRLQMLQKPKTKYSYTRRLLALPVLFSIGFAYLVNAENKEIVKTNILIDEMVSELVKQDTIKPTIKAKINDIKSINEEETKVIDNVALDSKINNNFSDNIKNASENALFIVNAKRVNKAKFIEYIKENPNSVVLHQDNSMNDDEHLVYGEIEKKYGVFQADDLDKMKDNVSKYHQLIKEINPKWYDEKIINHKYSKIGAVNLDINKKMEFEINDFPEPISKRDYNKNPLTEEEIVALKKEAEAMRVVAVKSIELRRRLSGNESLFFSADELKSYTVKDGNVISENEPVKSNLNLISTKNSEFYINGKKATIREVEELTSSFSEIKDGDNNYKLKSIKTYKTVAANNKIVFPMRVELTTKN